MISRRGEDCESSDSPVVVRRERVVIRRSRWPGAKRRMRDDVRERKTKESEREERVGSCIVSCRCSRHDRDSRGFGQCARAVFL